MNHHPVIIRDHPVTTLSLSASSTRFLNSSRDGDSTNTSFLPAQAEAITYVGLLYPKCTTCCLVLLNFIQLASTHWSSLSGTVCRAFMLSGRSILHPTLVWSAKCMYVTCSLNIVDEHCRVTLWRARRWMLNSCMFMLLLSSHLWEAHAEMAFFSAVFIVFVLWFLFLHVLASWELFWWHSSASASLPLQMAMRKWHSKYQQHWCTCPLIMPSPL